MALWPPPVAAAPPPGPPARLSFISLGSIAITLLPEGF